MSPRRSPAIDALNNDLHVGDRVVANSPYNFQKLEECTVVSVWRDEVDLRAIDDTNANIFCKPSEAVCLIIEYAPTNKKRRRSS